MSNDGYQPTGDPIPPDHVFAPGTTSAAQPPNGDSSQRFNFNASVIDANGDRYEVRIQDTPLAAERQLRLLWCLNENLASLAHSLARFSFNEE